MESMLQAPRGYAWALMGTVALAMAAMLALGAATAQAQTSNVCRGDPPATGEGINCTESDMSVDNIKIDTSGVTISTTADASPGINAEHAGNADIDIKASDINTMGVGSHGVSAKHTGTGNLMVTFKGEGNVETGEGGYGIFGRHEGTGNVTLVVEGVSGANTTIKTSPPPSGNNTLFSYAIAGDNGGLGGVDITVSDVTIMAEGFLTGENARGVSGQIWPSHVPAGDSLSSGDYDVEIDVSRSQISTMGRTAYGIYGEHTGTTATAVLNGDVNIAATNTDITTTGLYAAGIHGRNASAVGDIILNMRDGSITTEEEEGHGIDLFKTGESGDITATVTDAELRTKGIIAHGIYGRHEGIGAVNINVGDSTITTESTEAPSAFTFANGIYGRHVGTGAVTIDVRGGTITTMGVDSHGIYGRHEGTDDIDIFLQGGSITTKGRASHGIYVRHLGTEAGGDIVINTRNHVITTESTDLHPDYEETFSNGIYAQHQSIGNIKIDARGGGITTKGVFSYGLYARHEGDGDITIDTRDGHTITTTGDNGHGIVAYNYGTLPTDTTSINVGGNITTTGADAQGVRVGALNGTAPERVAAIGADGYRQQTVTVNGSVMGNAAGAFLAGGGRVVIGPRGTIGAQSGIAILATGTVPAVADDPNTPDDEALPAILPKLRVDLNLGGRRVAQAIGENWILNEGGETTIAVNNTVLHEGASGVVEGAVARNGAWNVRMREEGVTVTDHTTDPWMISTPPAGVITDRDFSTEDFNETRRPTPPPPPPAPEPSEHRVNERVFGGSGEAAGLLLEAGGAVYIGPEGSVGAESGIAILATGDAPDLLVDLTLEGRRVADVIGDDWIINDGGETTIVVNNVKLHDGATGVVPDAVAPNPVSTRGSLTSVVAANGAYDVRIRVEGVRVTDRTDPDPANWTVTEPALGVIADRDFSAEDFIEETAGEPGSPVFMEEYAPRAAVYEALPDFLLRLTGPGPNRKCRTAPEERVWVRFAGGQGSYEADRSTTGASYDLERFETEGGFSANFNERVKGWASVRHVWGSADAMSPTGGGAIDVRGLGSSVGGAWRSETGAYAMGCFSYMTYNVDMASRQAGLLRAGVDSRAFTLDFEAGLPFALTEQVQMTPRVWVVSSQVSVDSFTDAVEARVSFGDADRITGGLGFLADTTRPWGEGEFILRGSVDLERLLSGTETRVQVSGERLSAVATDSSLLVGLNGIYRQGRFSIGAEVAARQELGSNDSEYASFLNLGISF